MTPTENAIHIREVGLRDGLQSLARTLPTAAQAGVDPRRPRAPGCARSRSARSCRRELLPQLADTAELVAFAKTLPGLVDLGAGAQPQGRRARRSRAAPTRCCCRCRPAMRTAWPTCARRPMRWCARSPRSAPRATPPGRSCLIEVGMSHRVRLHDPGPRRAGRGAAADAGGARCRRRPRRPGRHRGLRRPGAGGARCSSRAFASPATRLACGHFHDTRGLGLANVYAAWQAGVRRFDACLAGIGGCPHAPGASGNVATEDVAYLFASMGVADRPRLRAR